jgi:3-hexulose-6-phosphate synthase/6-phospho-3-hexuloisomerase
VGSNIVKSARVTESARKVREAIDTADRQSLGIKKRKKDIEQEIKRIFMEVSTPNISDAMHRQPAMEGIKSMLKGKKMVGKAVTVNTFEGDWAKTVEAIDVAGKGDVLVIYCGSENITPWGALASRSCMIKGIEGVVIDGPVRDIEEIEEMGFPIFARGIVPNAGEPKGFGEINTKIICGGLEVRPGDWIVGDDNGVMVIPKERAYEIARRSLEVKKHEERIREEINRGRTLAEIVDLYKWEKVQK